MKITKRWQNIYIYIYIYICRYTQSTCITYVDFTSQEMDTSTSGQSCFGVFIIFGVILICYFFTTSGHPFCLHPFNPLRSTCLRSRLISFSFYLWKRHCFASLVPFPPRRESRMSHAVQRRQVVLSLLVKHTKQTQMMQESKPTLVSTRTSLYLRHSRGLRPGGGKTKLITTSSPELVWTA